jgi:hypothetical protein
MQFSNPADSNPVIRTGPLRSFGDGVISISWLPVPLVPANAIANAR